MGLDREAQAQHRIGLGRRKEQFAQEALLGLAKAHHGGIVQAVQIERVTVKSEQRQLAGFGIELLPVAVDHNNARSCRRVSEDAALGEDRYGAVRLPVVVDQQPDDFAALVTGANIDRELVSDRCEGSLLEQARNKAVADLELQILERAV